MADFNEVYQYVTEFGLKFDVQKSGKNKGKISVIKSLQKALNFDEFEFLISPDIHYMSHAELARLDKYLFVGHVPTFQLDINGQNYIIKNEFYTDLDSGSGYSGGRVCALRLDDMKEFYA